MKGKLTRAIMLRLLLRGAGMRLQRCAGCRMLEPVSQLRGGHRPGKQETLRRRAAQVDEDGCLAFIFHAFCNNRQIQIAPQLYHHLGNTAAA